MTYKTGSWGEKAKARSLNRKEYFINYSRKKNGNKQPFKSKGCIKINARQKVRDHVLSGRLVRPTECEDCGEVKKLDAHHHDYSKPLEVKWVCRACHTHIHRKPPTGL